MAGGFSGAQPPNMPKLLGCPADTYPFDRISDNYQFYLLSGFTHSTIRRVRTFFFDFSFDALMVQKKAWDTAQDSLRQGEWINHSAI